MSAGIQKNKWSVRTVNGKKGEYFIVTGRGYPSVIKGANPTKIIQASRFDREAFYRDPAVKLSMDDLDELDGAEGAPLCVEHKRDDVVGKIHHTWVDPGDPNQGWDIMARIPMNERGKRVVQDIKAGKLNGFSVGYKTDYDQNKHEKVLQGKTFHEISLVEEPFFSGCNLSVSVSASAKEEEIQEGHFFVPFNMSTDQQNLPAQTQNAAAPAAAAASTGPDPMQQLQGLAKQTDLLKEQLTESEKAKEAALHEKSKQDAEIQAKLKRLAELEAKDEAEAKSYAEKQTPKVEEYIKWLEETENKQLTEEEKKMFRSAFTVRKYQRDAERFDNQRKHAVELAASKKQQEEELKALKEEKQKWAEMISQNTSSVASMRAGYAAVLKPHGGMGLAESEAKHREQVGVAASRRDLNQIMVPVPSEFERGFLSAYNYHPAGSVEINASRANGDDDDIAARPYREYVEPASKHRLLVDESGERNFPASMRYHNPAVFGFMCNESNMQNYNLSDYVSINASKTFIEERRVNE